MPEIAGQVVNLTVSDVGRSAAWYCELLGMEEISRYAEPDRHVALAHLAEPGFEHLVSQPDRFS
jgi:catechol 2,3-dioxygenase-like lactoylglutathione lyase family enzyme